MPVDLSSLLADTLTAKGYRVQDAGPVEGASGASYPVSLVAERDGKRYLIDALASRPVRERDRAAVASIVEDTGFDGAIVLALEGIQDPGGPSQGPVEIWSRGEVDQAVGAHVLDEVLDGTLHPDDIGPTPTSEDQKTQAAPQTQTQPSKADPASTTDPQGQPTQATSRQAEGQPSAPSNEPSRDPGAPDTPASSEPEATPNAATADEGASEGTGVNQREYVDPEDMLERAERLMEEGEVDGGDAELLVEDEDPSPPSSQDQSVQSQGPSESGSAGSSTPSAEGPSPTEPEGGQDVGAQQGSRDAEILEEGPTEPSHSERPRPDAAPPEPETASTARGDVESNAGSSPGTGEGSSGASVASPAAAAGPGQDEEAFLSGVTIEPKVTQDEAQRKAEDVLFEAENTRLELLPFQVYRYDARLEGDGHTDHEEGEVWVSTQSGATVPAPQGDMIEEPEIPHERFQGDLSTMETKTAAREHLLDALERREEVRQDYSESAVIERVRLEPDPDELVLEPRGKAFAPRWRVEGKNGNVFVDAVTGELVTE